MLCTIKIQKAMAVDEVGEGNLLGSSSLKGEGAKRRATTGGTNASESRPPRRKPGPLPTDYFTRWRCVKKCNYSAAASV